MQETQLQSLGQEDPLEKEMARHSSILAWKIPWTEEPGGLQSMGVTKELNNIVAISYPSSSLDSELGQHHYVSLTCNIVLDT